jgi:hypothetical protein
LVVAVDHDEAIKRPHTEKLAAAIPGAGLLILPNKSNFSFLQDPEQFTWHVLPFLVQTPEWTTCVDSEAARFGRSCSNVEIAIPAIE